MLSLRRRQEEGGAGFRAMADDVELEEGEACSDDDDDQGGLGFVDPDVALSYIDEKLQHVLGHFQKDFEGGVSAEKLGPKFGGYGSFLPTYQRSPTPLPQSRRSSPMVANISTPRSPYQQPAEILGQNNSTVAVESISRNNVPTAPSSGDLCKSKICPSTNGEKDIVAPSVYLDSSFNDSGQKALKLRIRVDSSNALVKKKASIYSGLGLDISSSSSSMEGSPDSHEGLSPEFTTMPYDPRTILQIMTCFSVPGGFLLSPLHANVLQLTNKVAPLLKKWGKHLDVENIPSTYEGHSEPALHGERFRGQISKKKKAESKKKKSINTNTRNKLGDTKTIKSKEVHTEMASCQEIISDTPGIPSFSGVSATDLKRVSQFSEEPTRNACISRPYEQNKYVQLKEQIGGNDLATNKAEAMKEEAAKHTENCNFDKSGNGYQMKGEVRLKVTKVDMCLEEMDVTNHDHSPFYRKKESKVKPDRKYGAAIVNSESNEDVKDWEVPCEDLKKAPGKIIFASDRLGGDNYQTEFKRMDNEHKINAAAASEFLEDNNSTHSSAAAKDRKIDFQLKSNHFEKKTKAKSHTDINENLPIRSQVDTEGNMLENGTAQCELRPKEKINGNNEKELDMSVAAKEEIPVSIKHGKFLASAERELHMPSTSFITTTNTVPLPAPVVIEENWVCCDLCQKWRLLPYGTNPSMLPKKWKCSMLNWLPGMNRCDIGEDETTDALNTLYVTQVPAAGVSSCGPHTVAAGTAASNSYNISGQLEQSRKRKITLKDENTLVESSYPTPSPIPLMSNPQVPTKNKRTIDSDHYPFEANFGNKHGLGPVSTSADFVVENQKLKHKRCNSYSDRGDLMEKFKKHAEFQSKRENDQDEHKASKKCKKVNQHHFDRDWNQECDLSGRNVHDETKRFPTKEKPIKNSCEQGGISVHKERVSSRYDLLEKNKKIDDEDAAFVMEKKEHHKDVEIIDLSSKKTISKECEKIQSADNTSKGYKNDNLKERKPTIIKSEELMSKVDTRPVKARDADKVLSSAEGCLNNELVADNKYVTGKEVASELWENLPPKQALELAEPNRRPDAAYLQTSTVATSSSSKISSSWRNKNSEEAKGSPVGSVSSSPLRNFNTEKLSRGRITGKDGSLNADSNMHNSGIKVGELYNDNHGRNFGESQAAGEPILHSGNKHPKVSSRKEKTQPSVDNKEMRKHNVAQVARSHLKEGKSEVHSTPVKSDASKMKAHLKRSSVEIGYGIVKQAILNTSDTASPIRKDNNMVAFALKEARDLKHMANHLKNKGQVLESTGLYFEAALKFLHVACLLETPSIDGSRPADAAQSMKMYSETAKLCDFCAHAYERCKEMAAAALAYKCVEVAYLKAAYYKHPSASKDRQELQAVVQIAPGESPSSSASDIENLNSHGVSKATSTKGRNSPLVAGNLLPLAVRNQAHLLRLLAYTNDVNCAFDATRKSQIALASSAGNQEGGKGVDDGLGSVRTVLDLNFNNVDELLRLVRLSMESIGS
uniref:Uncharacterized protein n=1 Tax=Avena sativa TaxID=4498 RepID=A0ACD5XQ29_AVESA